MAMIMINNNNNNNNNNNHKNYVDKYYKNDNYIKKIT